MPRLDNWSARALLLITVAAVTTACGSSTSAQVTKTPAAAASCTTGGTPRALVGSLSGSQLSIYNLTDPMNPTVLCTVAQVNRPKFVSATTISFVTIANFTPSTSFTDYQSNITLLNLTDNSRKTVASATGNVWDFGWSRDGSALAYELQTAAGYQLFLKRSDAGPVAITKVRTNVKLQGGPGDGVWVTFSPSGSYLAEANTLAQGAHIQVFKVSDGSLVWSAAKGGSPIWSRSAGDRLFFEDFAGEHAWQPGGSVTTIAPDGWVDPSQSPDGCCIAYTVGDGQTPPQAETHDLRSGISNRLPATLGAGPVYASADVFWLWEMTQRQGPGIGPPYQMSGVSRAYEIRTQKQASLPFSGQSNDPTVVFDVWSG